MMKRILIFLTAMLGATAFSQQGQQVNPNDIQELLKRLQRIQDQQNALKINAVNEALRKIEAGAANGGAAWNMYEDAVKATRFEGKKDDARNFEEWRSKEGRALRASSMQAAIQLQLRYLALALRWNAMEDKAPLVPQVKNYIKGLMDAEKTFGHAPLPDEGKKLINQPITSSLFVTWLGIAPMLPPASDWEPVPDNLEGILNKTLRPQLRKIKSAELMELWNQQIQLETERAANQQLDLEKEKFATVRQPQLRWGRAEDGLLLGYTKAGYMEMLTIIETNPKHPDRDKWVQRMIELLGKENALPVPVKNEVPPAPTAAAPALETSSAAATPDPVSQSAGETGVPTVPASTPSSATTVSVPAPAAPSPAAAPPATTLPSESPGTIPQPVSSPIPAPLGTPTTVVPAASPVSSPTAAPGVPRMIPPSSPAPTTSGEVEKL